MFLVHVGCGWPRVLSSSKETVPSSSLWLMTSLLCAGLPRHVQLSHSSCLPFLLHICVLWFSHWDCILFLQCIPSHSLHMGSRTLHPTCVPPVCCSSCASGIAWGCGVIWTLSLHPEFGIRALFSHSLPEHKVGREAALIRRVLSRPPKQPSTANPTEEEEESKPKLLFLPYVQGVSERIEGVVWFEHCPYTQSSAPLTLDFLPNPPRGCAYSTQQ